MRKLSLLGLLLFFIAGCYYDNYQELNPGIGLDTNCDTTVTMSYANDIQPILDQSCGAQGNGCHSSSVASGNVKLNTWDNTKVVAANGKLVSAVIWDGNAINMPYQSSSKIKDCSINKIYKWVNIQGYPNN